MASSYYDSSGKSVVDGDIAYASDVNDINVAVDTGFQLVEAAVTSVSSGASFYADIAEKWAINPEDVAINPGEYSSLHWAAKSEISKNTSTAQAVISTTKANEASVSASSASSSSSTATTQAGTATTQAGIATTQAGTATTQAGIATTQAGIATTKASEAAASALAAQNAMAGKADLASPTFTGVPAAPTAVAGTNTTQVATTAFVTTADNLKANIASPTFTGVPAAPTASVGTNTTQLATTSFVKAEISATAVLPATNFLINGSFNVWQRAVSQTSSGYGSDDRWINLHTGSSKTHSRQSFSLGQTDVPGNPKYFSRTVVTSSAGAGNYCLKGQRIEGVSSVSGENVTVSFYAKSNASRNIAISFTQNFGTTGNPSSSVTGIGSQLKALTTSWAKYTATIAIPSVSGKTLGSDNNDYLQLNFWFDAGSSFNTEADSLGQQSGTFDIALVQVERGSVVSTFTTVLPGNELLLCQRYYEVGSFSSFWGNVTNAQNYGATTSFSVTKRAVPNMTTTNIYNASFGASPVSVVPYTGAFYEVRSATATSLGQFQSSWTADAEL